MLYTRTEFRASGKEQTRVAIVQSVLNAYTENRK